MQQLYKLIIISSRLHGVFHDWTFRAKNLTRSYSSVPENSRLLGLGDAFVYNWLFFDIHCMNVLIFLCLK
jgi:hypothetical protein